MIDYHYESLIKFKTKSYNLIGVEYDGLLGVELLHHLHGDAVDGRLEVGLLRVHHHPHVHLLRRLKFTCFKF